jgi:predicted Co/Zn/Cd cation transporter (cation efflux family)
MGQGTAPGQQPAPRVRPGTVCNARVWGTKSGRAVTIEVTLVVAADETGYEVWGYRLDRLRHRMGHMQSQRPRHYWIPVAWL